MKRLVYSPKAYVFIYSNKDKKVYDVSDWVVSGSVNRKINEPSTAEFVLRNKYHRFTSHNGQFPKFMPMDGVSIWLQRIGGRPIQVFTGYLDEVPYMQLYPGDVRFAATCTLKRLLHTYFDPGVPEMFKWFEKNGWTYSPSTGQAVDPDQQTGDVPAGAKGFGDLLMSFLTEIAGWDESAIVISKLPDALPKMLAQLYKKQVEMSKDSTKRLEAIMSGLLTVSGAQASGGSSDVSFIETSKKIVTAADAVSLDATIFILTALSLTGMNADYEDDDPTSEGFGAGIYALSPSSSETEPGREGQTVYKYGKYSQAEIHNINNSTKELYIRMRGALPSRSSEPGRTGTISQQLNVHNIAALSRIVSIATGKPQYRDQIAFAMNKNLEFAQQLVSAARSDNDANITVGNPVQFSEATDATMPNNLTWDNVFDQSPSATQDSRTTFDQKYKQYLSSNTRLASYYYVALQNGLDFIDIGEGFDRGTSFAVGINSAHRNDSDADKQRALTNFAEWAGTQPTTYVGYRAGDSYGVYRNGRQAVRGNTPDFNERENGNVERDSVVISAAASSRPPVYFGSALTNRQVIADDAAADLNAGVLTFEDLARFAFGAAFTARFAFDTNTFESFILSGERSIMNDIPTMKFVEEAAGASMRHFMSLPDGRFAAFYPDYFGAFGRNPYWNIYDIEITNMGVQYSDNPLATHVMVTGSQYSSIKEVSPMNIATSAGFVTFEDMFKYVDFISGKSEVSKSLAKTAKNFYQHYGARPLRLDQPIIKVRWFELLYAVQLFTFQWAKQFSTLCEFTFQPELMAGGRVGFPDHDLQMYVQSVTHNWSYENGFDTSAELIAPSSTKDGVWPGFALTGTISGIGAISG